MNIHSIHTGLFKEGESLPHFLRKNIKTLHEKSVVVITSKIVALAEKRTIPVSKMKNKKEKIIRNESSVAYKTKYVWLTLKDDLLMANAGIDESNGNGRYILLPKNSMRAAQTLQKQIKKMYGIRQVGVLITDSHTAPLRAGVTGIALGYAGFKGIYDYRGKRDLFGRPFSFSKVNVADSLAAAAVLTMGEGNERKPLAVIKNVPVTFTDKTPKRELIIPFADDMYLPYLKNLRNQTGSSKK